MAKTPKGTFGAKQGFGAMKKYPKTYKGKSTKLGHGGRSAKLKDQLQAKGLPAKYLKIHGK